MTVGGYSCEQRFRANSLAPQNSPASTEWTILDIQFDQKTACLTFKSGYTADNIRERLNMRDFMDDLRGSGVDTGGPPALNQTDRRNFANQLDRLLIKLTAGKRQ